MYSLNNIYFQIIFHYDSLCEIPMSYLTAYLKSTELKHKHAHIDCIHNEVYV